MEINEVLRNIQQELIAPKNQWNAFGKYKYRSCEDILEGLKKPLAKYDACVTLEDEMVNLGDRFYVKATARLLTSDNVIVTTALAREPESKKGMDASQITGTASSYARKYALNGLFAIDDEKDADARKPETEPEKKVMMNNQIAEKLAKEKPPVIQNILNHYKVKEISELNGEQLQELSKKMKWS